MHDEGIKVWMRARDEARERLQRKDPEGVFLTIANIDTGGQSLQIGEWLDLEPLEASPLVYGTESMKLSGPKHQLFFSDTVNEETLRWPEPALVGLFRTATALLRIATSGFIVAGDFSNRSWDIVDGLPSDAKPFLHSTGGRYRAWWPSDPVLITQDDCDYASTSLFPCLRLRQNRAFKFALDSFDSSFQEVDLRMAASKVWAGIEALFNINSELRYRLSLYISTVLHGPGGQREAEYRRLVKLYDQRSKVVHGSSIDAYKLLEHVLAAQATLSGLLAAAISAERMWTGEEVERALLGGTPLFEARREMIHPRPTDSPHGEAPLRTRERCLLASDA